MFRNYLKIALRNFLKFRTFSIVNVIGLSIGIACCVLIMLFVQYELSYDRFHKNSDHIYRALTELQTAFNDSANMNRVPTPLGEALEDNFPEVVRTVSFGERRPLISYGDLAFNDSRLLFVEQDFLSFFTFPLISGDPASVLSEPYSVVISQQMADRVFGDEDPVGKFLQYGTVFELKVTGIVENVPDNSHMHFDFLASAATVSDYWKDSGLGQGSVSLGTYSEWTSLRQMTYVQFRPDVDVEEFTGKFDTWVSQFYEDGQAMSYTFQPMTDIHLKGNSAYELETNSDIKYVYFVSAMALLILMIACFNYMNLSTARSTNRAREVGMRKVLGAGRASLVRQFLGESVIITLVAMVAAVSLVEFALPYFESLIGTQIDDNWYADHTVLAGLGAIVILVGLIAGIYPALFMSSFKPLRILKGALTADSRGPSVFRNGLVVLQYAISIILIIATVVVFQQLHFMESKNPGFETENVVALPIRDFRLLGGFKTLKSELLKHPQITDVTASLSYPSRRGGGAGRCWWEGQEEGENVPFYYTDIDYNFLDFYGIELLEGRNFSEEFTTDRKKAYILNETALKRLGWDTAVGKEFGLHKNRKGRVVGVVRDFHFASLHQQIEPLAIMLNPGLLRSLAVKVSPNNVSETIAFIESRWKDYSKFPFEYYFIDERIAAQYQEEQRLGRIFTYSTVIAVFVACLGLFGLASYSAERRIREIGIRKVLGASVSGIALLLVRQFTRWVIIANVIAWPLAWWAISTWLQNFAYRIELRPEVFLGAGLAALVIAIATVTSLSVSAARTNPVDTLKCD